MWSEIRSDGGRLAMMKKASAKIAKLKGNGIVKPIDLSAEVQKIHDALNAIEQYKAENPGVDVDALLSAQNELYPMLRRISGREVDKFVSHAKEQGTKMPFDSMETGIVAAGRKDMQNGLAEILNSLKFEKPICPVTECNEALDNLGRSKKKL
jgi:hypothetical protein